MVMDNVTSAVIRYLKSNNPFALQINGPWGSGKTYFIEHTIIPYIKGNEIHDKKFIPVYISLNSVNNISDLKSKLCNSLVLCNSQIYGNKHMWEGLKDAFTFTQSDLFHKLKIGYNTIKGYIIRNILSKHNTVIIFDDLERANNISSTDLLGFLSNVINVSNINDKRLTHPRCRMIIISNEDKIISESNKKENEKSIFKDSKERIISKTIDFNYISTRFIAEKMIFGSISDNIIDLMGKTWLINVLNFMIKQLSSINLRTILSISYTFQSFYKSFIEYCRMTNLRKFNKTDFPFNKLNKYFNQQLMRMGFLSIFVLTDAIKRNKTIYIENLIKNSCTKKIISKEFKLNNKISYTNGYINNTFFNLYNSEFDWNMFCTIDIYRLVANDEFNINNFVINSYDLLIRNNVKARLLYDVLFNRYKFMDDSKIQLYEYYIVQFINIDSDINLLINIYSMFYNFKKDLIIINFDFIKYVKSLIIKKIKNLNNDKVNVIPTLNNNNISNIPDKKLLSYIQKSIKHQKSQYDSEIHLEPILQGDFSNISNSWISNNSIFGSVLDNPRLQRDAYMKPGSVYLQEYLSSEISKKHYKIHKVELKYINAFISLLRNVIDKSNIDSTGKYDLKKLIVTVKQFNKQLSKHDGGNDFNKVEITDSDLPF